MNDRSVEAVRAYWEAHPLGTQYVKDPDLVPGTKEFYHHIRPWMNPYKFPEIMPRIEAEAMQLQDRHLLEIGCGMGFDSAEFLKRGVKVTATDLTPAAVRLARQHFELFGLQPADARVENVLDLSFPDETFDAVWATGVIHHTGDSRRAIAEIRRVLKPGGRAIISHFYRRPSWMQLISRLGRENIEFSDADPPVIDFMRERDVLDLFDGFEIERVHRDHYRALPIARQGWKAALYSGVFRPAYNLLPVTIATRLAYKFSVKAMKAVKAVKAVNAVKAVRLGAEGNSAAVVEDRRILAAVNEERTSRGCSCSSRAGFPRSTT
jgi:SAM-dependent methyltransferase